MYVYHHFYTMNSKILITKYIYMVHMAVTTKTILSLHSINVLVVLVEARCIPYEVASQYLCITQVNVSIQRASLVSMLNSNIKSCHKTPRHQRLEELFRIIRV